MRTDAKFAVRADPRCVAVARQLIDERCSPLPREEDINALKLLVSELVTNVIRHTPTGEGELRIQCDKRLVRVEVQDNGGGLPAGLRTPDRELGGGFGLHLVDRLSDRWGVRGRTCVWFEIDMPRARASTPARTRSARRGTAPRITA